MFLLGYDKFTELLQLVLENLLCNLFVLMVMTNLSYPFGVYDMFVVS